MYCIHIQPLNSHYSIPNTTANIMITYMPLGPPFHHYSMLKLVYQIIMVKCMA